VRQAFVEQEQGNHVCACGCDCAIPIRVSHYSSGIPKFIQGHNAKLVAPPGKRNGRTRELRATMGPTLVEEYEAGATCKELGDKYDASYTTIWKIVKEFGGTIRPPVVSTGGPFHGKWGAEHPHWKDGTMITADGYRKTWIPPGHPFSAMQHKGTSYVYEHRLVMAHHLGRPLRKGETVHHIDGNRLNNDISNLQLRQGAHGMGAKVGCRDCGSYNVGPLPLD